MEEDNKTIAIFMGALPKPIDGLLSSYMDENQVNFAVEDYPESHDGSTWDISDLKYHLSWDWLMPVVIKIKKLDHIAGMDFEILERLDDAFIQPEIDWLHEKVVYAIEWYNENKV